MREIRPSGSEGGGTEPIGPPYPYLSHVSHRTVGPASSPVAERPEHASV
jgi:hypothetical protein